MEKKRIASWSRFLVGMVVTVFVAMGALPWHVEAKTPKKPAVLKSEIEELGKRIFFDKISVPPRQSCSSCHDANTGGTHPKSHINEHQVAANGAKRHTKGTLKPPTNAYATFIPEFQSCAAGFYQLCGGNFWNGRSEGNDDAVFPAGSTQHVGDEIFENVGPEVKAAYEKYLGPVADQALNPFPNPVEQNIEVQEVCEQVKESKYVQLFNDVWEEPINCRDEGYGTKGFKAYEVNFRRIAVALSAWQASAEVNSFSSRRDKALAKDGDKAFPLAGFTAKENWGHDLFYGITSPRNPTGKNAGCSACHLSDSSKPDGTGTFERYTDDAYHNIGTPANPEIPGYPVPDLGLAGHTGTNNPIPSVVPFLRAVPFGFHKTPTLRNVDKRPHKKFTKAYTHNGWFKSLESIVHFYNTAFLGDSNIPYEQTTAYKFGITRCDPSVFWTEEDALRFDCWPEPEVSGPGGAIGILLGNLDLTRKEEDAIVAYLKTFTDTYTAKAPEPYKK